MDNTELLDKIKQIIKGDEDNKTTITEAYDLFIKHNKNILREGTISFYNTIFYTSVLVFCNKHNITKLIELNNKFMFEYVAYLEDERHVGPNTINKRITFIKTLLNHSVLIGLISNNQVANFKPLKKVEHETPFIPDVVVKRIFKYLDSLPHNYRNLMHNVVVRLLHDTGIRLNELYNLKVENLDIDNLKIRLAFTKTGKPRTVYITSSTRDYIKEYLAMSDNKEYLLNLKSKRLERRSIAKILTNINEKLSLPCSISSHKWRHTLASTLLANGVNLKTVQNILGHYNISVTSKYIHTNEEIDKEAFYKVFN